MKKDNGSLPAFPPALAGVGGGLTKREIIAAMALQGILSRSNRDLEDFEFGSEMLAVSMADRLLSELGKDNAE